MDADPQHSLTAKDARKLAGLSYRQLNDWESRGAIPGKRGKEKGWRRFTPKQIFALMIAKEIRDSYGIPVEKVRFVIDFMMREEHDHLAATIRLMKYGLHVFLLTDLEKTFIIDSDLELGALMDRGLFRNEDTGPHIFLRLNGLLNRLLPATTGPQEIQTSDQQYQKIARLEASLCVRTVAELDLLQAIRSGDTKGIEVEVREGKIRSINTEVNIELENIEASDGVVKVAQTSEFEDVTLSTRDGKVVKARRTLPRKYKKKDNENVIFQLLVESIEDDLPAEQ